MTVVVRKVRGDLTTPEGQTYVNVALYETDRHTVEVWGQNGRHEGEQHPRHRRFVKVATYEEAGLTNNGGRPPTAALTVDGVEWPPIPLYPKQFCCGAAYRDFEP